ncbi:MAG: hypothetical protein ACFB15_04615, partial [Cyclobacteriaceae bacterium]
LVRITLGLYYLFDAFFHMLGVFVDPFIDRSTRYLIFPAYLQNGRQVHLNFVDLLLFEGLTEIAIMSLLSDG